jgi:hydroxyacylglutathione hydrolase
MGAPGNRSMIVRQMAVGPMANFVYLLIEQDTGEAMVVDSGWETAPIIKAVEDSKSSVRFVVSTHSHFDHSSTLGELAQALGAQVVAHGNSPVERDVTVNDKEELRLGKRRVRIIHTPGHTEDSICLYDDENLFTGDTLFVGTIGKFTRESSTAMFESLRAIMKLPDSTMIYPGHDYGEAPFRTLGEEKASNPFLLARDIRDFLSLFA